jgi:hypothetical protein
MKITINILPAIGSVITFGATYSLLTGSLQKLVPFAASLNEVATTICTFIMGLMCLYCAFDSPTKINK